MATAVPFMAELSEEISRVKPIKEWNGTQGAEGVEVTGEGE